MPSRIERFDISKLESVPREFWCWFSGFFDGEGNIEKKTYTIRLTQAGARAEPVMKGIQSFLGGTISFRDPRVKPHHLPQYEWWVCKGDHSVAILQYALPYLRIKREEAKAFIYRAANPNPRKRSNREWSDDELEALKQMLGNARISKIAQAISGRTRLAITEKLCKLGIRGRMGRRWYSDEYRREICEKRRAGMTLQALRDETGLSMTTIAAWVREYDSQQADTACHLLPFSGCASGSSPQKDA